MRAKAEREEVPIHQFDHKERKDDVANRIRKQRGIRDGIVLVRVAQEKAQDLRGKNISGQFEVTRDKIVYVNHYYFYIDDAEFGPLFLKVCSYAPWGISAELGPTKARTILANGERPHSFHAESTHIPIRIDIPRRV